MKISTSPFRHANIEMMPLVTITQMCQLLGISRVTLYRRVKTKQITPPVMRNKRTLGWRPEHIKELQIS
jgi:predicted DNA-binding transcriptional regulator AlpA